ncbi:MAG: UDP-2,3-diacylglucosamine diphosphatase [Pseudomonadota bacterium]
MNVLFISDLHISPAQPEIGEQLIAFLSSQATGADALYILGDLFEAWIGDDDPDPHYAEVQNALRRLTDTGVPGFIMHGNRDFLLGERFCARTGLTLLSDPLVIDIAGESVLLSHGDAYCTDDTEYQAVRQTVRNPAWQAQVLSLPIEARRQLAGDARAESSASNQQKSDDIMDVNDRAIEDALRAHGVTQMLHGHTHRPAIHEWQLDEDKTARRMVLGDWYSQGSVGVWDNSGFALTTLPR